MAKDPEIKRLMIDETRKLIEEKGHVTIKDISERCYVNIASVNYYFGSKDNLMFIVLTEVLTEIKVKIIRLVNENEEKNIEKFLENVIGYIYNFAIENVGLLRYFFLSAGMKEGQLYEFVRSFFLDPEFVEIVYKSLGEYLQTDDMKLLQVKYLIIFSSFFMPLFIQIIQPKQDERNHMATFKDPDFKKYFIEQILKMIK